MLTGYCLAAGKHRENKIMHDDNGYDMVPFEDRKAAEWDGTPIEEQCAARCYKKLFGYHTGNCPLVTEEDERRESRDQARVDYAQGK